MGYKRDISWLSELTTTIDPSFDVVARSLVAAEIESVGASSSSITNFVLGVMRLCALAKNGHTRAIPNEVVGVAPMRFVWFSDGPYVVEANGRFSDLVGSALVGVNGEDISAVFKNFAPWLAGTAQRQTVIGAMLFAWPQGLATLLGLGRTASAELSFRLPDGRIQEHALTKTQTIPATHLYPIREPGVIAQIIQGNGLATDTEVARFGRYCLPIYGKPIHYIRLGDFQDGQKLQLSNDLSRIQKQLVSTPMSAAILDLRGNPGGNFLLTVDFCKRFSELLSPPASSVILVDRFTFSAAIVAVALMRVHANPMPLIFGEEMGDQTRFFAEGDTTILPESRLPIRYSTGYHDWLHGVPHTTLTPKVIADAMVAAGSLKPDRAIPFSGLDFFSGKDSTLTAAVSYLEQSI